MLAKKKLDQKINNKVLQEVITWILPTNRVRTMFDDVQIVSNGIESRAPIIQKSKGIETGSNE